MKSTIQRALFAVAVATLGTGAMGTACAQSTSSAPSGAPVHHVHHGHFRGFGRSPFVSTLLRATRQMGVVQPSLALSPQQQDSIKTILAGARHSHQPNTASQGPGITVLGDPSSSGYAAAVQAAETAAQNRIQQQSQLEQQIYDLLSKSQRDALPNVLASIQSKEQVRRAQWSARHSGNG